MNKKRMIKKVFAILLTLVLVLTGINVPALTPRAASEIDITPSSASGTVTVGSSDTTVDVTFALPDDMNEKTEFDAAGVKSMTVVFSVSEYTADGTAGVMPFFESNGSDSWSNGGVWQNLSLNTQLTVSLDLSSYDWKSGTSVNKLGIQFANLASGSTLSYSISSVKLSTGETSSEDSETVDTDRTNDSGVTATVAVQGTASSDWTGFDVTLTNNTGASICDWVIVMQVPSGYASVFKCWNSTFVADGDTIYLYPMQSGGNAVVAAGTLSANTPGFGFSSKYVSASEITVSKVLYNVGTTSTKDYSDGETNDDSSSSGDSGSVNIPAGTVTDYNYSDIDYNYAKLLQYSLYFYDANMCGSEVGEKSLHSWRDDCHTYDVYTYTRSDGSTVSVDLTGGFHDAGDHVKFGLPEAYAAFTLGMSYDTNKSAYEAAKQVEHLETITTHFADYLVKCAVLNSAGTSVEAFCVQVGAGGADYDHGYWGAPEDQAQGNRTAYFSSSSAPHTDIVSLSAAALAMQYKNFGGDEYLETAELLFAYAKNNSKAVGTTAGSSFYNSSGWADDYCLAALLLYQITGDATYKTEYDNYKSNDDAMKPYWPLGWDNVGPAVAYYAEDSSKLSTLMGISNGNSTYGGYRCVDDWGSARYNTSMQYTGLLYDKLTSTDTYRSWAEGQMKFLMGNNASKQCFIVGYNDYGPKYPHHRAASGYTGEVQATKEQTNLLLGALVGGPNTSGVYTDSASDYYSNEVAIDYNATLVAAAAALYEEYTTDATTQYVDSNYHVDSSSSSEEEEETGETVNLAITGEFDYAQAYEILDLTNTQRTENGVSNNLTMDAELMEAAMLRAAEIALSFDHTRPNGEKCYTACSEMSAENVAVNFSASQVMDAWMDSDGHKTNILNSSYNSIGIGVFEHNGYTYYVQCFGTDTATTTTQPDNVTKSVDVEILKSSVTNATLAFASSSYSVKAGNATTANVKMTNLEWSSASAILDPSNFTYSFSPTGVATISDGVITPTANGTTTLKAKLNAVTTKQVTATVTASGFVESVSLDKTALELDTNGTKTATLTATVLPTTASDKTVSWKSSDEKVATVSSSGVVTAVGVGTATITVTTTDGSKTATCAVTIYETQDAPSAPTKASVTSDSITLVAMDGCEYSMDKTNWTTSTTFTGLSANTEYTFYARKAADGYYKVSEASAGATIKTSPISVTGITLDKTELTLDKGNTAQLTVTVEPSNATDKSYTYSIGSTAVATFDSSTGKVTAVGAGKTTLTVTTTDGSKTASCTIMVYDTYAAPAAPTIDSKTATSVTLKATSGYSYSKDGVNWQSSATFDGLTPNTEYTFYQKRVASGYYYESPASAGTTIKTLPVYVTSVSLDKTSVELEMGGDNETLTAKLTATIAPSDASVKTVTWTSSDKSVATVDASGNVTAVGPGTATITVQATGGENTQPSATCSVTVWETPEVPTTTPTTSTTPTSDTITLTYYEGCEYRIAPDGQWQDSNVFTGLEAGTEYTFEIRVKADADNNIREGEAVTITVSTLAEGETAVAVTGVAFDDKLSESCSITMGASDSWSFAATVIPENATNPAVTYTSSNTAVATIDENGKVTPVAPGYTEITVTTTEGGYTDTIKLSVYKKYDTPSAPTLASKTTTTVTLSKVSGCKYSKDGVNWQDSNVFTGLTANTSYTFYVKKSASGYWLESDKSAGLKVTTASEPVVEEPFVAPDINVSYKTHVQTYGWQDWKSNGAMSGTSGKSKRLEGINIVVNPATTCEDLDLGIQYTTHCQSYGWLPWSADGDMNGTEGEAKRLEAIMIQLTGEHAELYDVYYRVHAQSYGWLGWAKNGEPAGTAGYGKRLEGIQIVVVKKGESFNQAMEGITSAKTDAFVAKAGSSPIVNYPATSNTNPVVPGEDIVNVTYRTHVQSFGWQGWKYNGQMSGTSGLAKRLEGIEIKVTNKDYEGGIAYCTHVQTYGWQGAKLDDPTTWKQDGAMAGTSGEAKRLEAICITLTGEMAEHYDIYYRVHAQSYGWLGWASNGDPAGTAGYAKRLEGIQIVIVPKGEAAPANTYMGVTSVKTQAYVEK